METFQTDSEIGFQSPIRQIEPSGQLFPMPINLATSPSFCNCVSQPAKFAFACHMDIADENRQERCAPNTVSLCYQLSDRAPL